MKSKTFSKVTGTEHTYADTHGNSMSPTVNVQIATADDSVPSEQQLEAWVAAALPADKAHMEVTIRVVGMAESQALNAQYRHIDKPTNVLSFPSDLPPDVEVPLLGDLVICAPVVESEAHAQGKELDAHWAHMVVHGTLHLLGHDHIDDLQADTMERLETDILASLNYAPPYE